MVKAEKFIRWEKDIVPLLMSSIFLYLIFITTYSIITGNKLYDIRYNIAAIVTLVGLVLFIYLSILFPRKHPVEFQKYKRHAQKNLDLKKGKIGLTIIFIIGFLLLLTTISFWYKFGPDIELTEILLISVGGLIISGFGLYFIHLLEK